MAGAFLGVRWGIVALVLASVLVSGALATPGLPQAPVERLSLHPLEQGSLPVEVSLGAAPAGRYALLLQADGLILEERIVVLTGEPRRVVLYAPPGSREVRVNGAVARETVDGPAVETSVPSGETWTPPSWLYPLLGAPLLLRLRPRMRSLREKWGLEVRYPGEYEAQRSLRMFERTWRQRYVQLAQLSRNLERRGRGAATAG